MEPNVSAVGLLSQALQAFFAASVQSANTSFNSLLDALLSTARGPGGGGGPASKQAFYSIAQCAAVLCLAAGDSKCSATVAMLITTLKEGSGSDSVRA